MLKLYLICLSYLLIVTDVVRCVPDYLFNSEARGWLKLHANPETWEEAILRCHYEGVQLQGSYGSENGDCIVMSLFSNSSFILKKSSCDYRLPYICYRKFDNITMNECGTFDNAYQLNEHTGSCYKVHQETRNWTRAFRICASEGGYLVILNNDEEARIVKDMFPKKLKQWPAFHMGVVAWGDDRIWMTIHGDRIEDVYHGWNVIQSGNRGGKEMIDKRYANLLNERSLIPINGQDKSMFVCEKSPDSIRFEAPPVPI